MRRRSPLACCVVMLSLASAVCAEYSPEAPEVKSSRAADSKSRSAPPVASGTLEDPAPAETAATPKVRITHSRRKPPTPVTQAAWESLAAGKWIEARRMYERVLASEPRNPEALLGLAHIALAQHQRNTAQDFVQRALEAHPLHVPAIALNLLLISGGDALSAHSALKNLIANQGPVATAHFALGHILARQSRWQDASESFFSAWSLEPDNPDYQYNLAVSLDHLGQPALALEHYRGALSAAGHRPGAFDISQTEARIRHLGETRGEALPGQSK